MSPESFEQNNIYEQVIPIEGEKLPGDIVEKIESFEKRKPEGIGSAFDTENILLVRSGVKPASIIEVWGDFEEQNVKEFGPDREKILNEEIQKVSDFLKDIGLFLKVEKPTLYDVENEDGTIFFRQESVDILIARNENYLYDLSDAVRAESHEKMGRALGYPESAVREFIGQREEMKKSDLPQEIKESGMYPFIQFRLSKDHWMEELGTVRAWANAIKKNSPKLFNRVLEESRNSPEYLQDINKKID